ncbi:cytochrome P450 [Phyllosticta paracitricarpa]|uniref:Cytochrome P450 n=1 Tax=Phyllosticta paracitricarpa TaxID=2016321 RepID=A0ABR1N9Z2_9PEZI
MWNLHVGDMVCQRDYVKAVKSQLNFSLPSMTTYIADQTDLAIAERIAPPPNFTCWRAVMFWNATLDIIHRVTAAIRLILSILGYPEYLELLRTEIETALKECGGWNKEAAAKMPKLDSFLHETSYCLDPENYDRPLEFDPWRFYDALTDTIKLISLISFGYGTQNCSGSFLATESSKIVLAQLIVDYEMKLTPKRIGKPVDWPIGGQIMACIDTYVSFGQRTH